MNEEINKESTQEPKVESAEGLNEIISQEEAIEHPTTQNSTLQTENMEVHHHPKVEKKKFKGYFFGMKKIFVTGNNNSNQLWLCHSLVRSVYY